MHHNLGTSTAICAGYPKGLNEQGNKTDACQGDSGGPLVRKHPQAGYELVGLGMILYLFGTESVILKFLSFLGLWMC